MSSRYLISSLGAQGDGVAEADGGHVFIPFTLPGETVTAVRAKDRAELLAVLEASPQRVAPPCRHFGECGGCALQHLEPAAYLEWKRGKVMQALASRGIDATVGETIACPPASRRRALLSARRSDNVMLLGYSRAPSHRLINIEECPITLPGIVAALPILRQLASIICATGDTFRLAVTATEPGLDVAASGSGPLSERSRQLASAYVLRNGIARLSVDGEIVIEPVKPQVTFGSAAVIPPPGAFLQAVASAEAAMAELVGGHLRKARKVADLFAGIGTFALRLAARSEVHAVEADAAALAALDRGFRFANGLKRVTTEKRDLFRRPLTFKELNAFDAVVFDPPRAGAEDQSKQLARSDVPLVAAVSCNPVTLARDLALLIVGGYAVRSVTPVDQFLWSPHVEAVALLEKPRKRR